LPLAGPPRTRTNFAVRILEPAAGAYVFGRSKITAEVPTEGEVRIESVEFKVGEETIFIDTEPPYQCVYDFGDMPRSWVIHTVARSADGRQREDTVVTRKIDIDYVVEVNRVILNAIVISRDGANDYVLDLGKNEFVLEEDGVVQDVIDFYLERRPLSVALLLDTSGSLREEMSDVHAAASGFVEALGSEDRGMVIEFNDRVYLLQDLTDRRDLLLESVSSTEAQGPTAMYDALMASLRRLGKIEGRRAIVLLTDGADTSSQTTYDGVLERVRLSEVVVYTIGLGSTFLDVSLRSRLKEIARVTGGRAFFASKADELRGVYEEIIRELSHQYYLTYAPSNQDWDGRWRKISLEVKKRKVRVRTRTGYYGVRPG
jgi:Ca-activated chloride channel family protein